jgi:hypothetical protein
MSRDFRIEGQFNEVTQRWDIDINVDGITHYHHGKNLEVALDKAGTVVRRESGPPSDSVTVNRDDLANAVGPVHARLVAADRLAETAQAYLNHSASSDTVNLELEGGLMAALAVYRDENRTERVMDASASAVTTSPEVKSTNEGDEN